MATITELITIGLQTTHDTAASWFDSRAKMQNILDAGTRHFANLVAQFRHVMPATL
jgi:hypothetical protein